MRRLSGHVLLLMLLVYSAVSVYAQDEGEDAILPINRLMALVPDTQAGQSSMIYYADIRVAEQARGLMPIMDALRWRMLTEIGDEAAWYFSLPMTIGPYDLQNSIYLAVDDMLRLTGISLFQMDQTLYFGNLPGVGNVLYGRFNADTITQALTERGYTVETDDDVQLLCGPDGCDSGLMVNIEEREPGNPFGGNLGRVEPFALAENFVMNSADIATLENIMSTYQGNQDALLENPVYAAAMESITQDGLLRQAIFARAVDVFGEDPLLSIFGTSATAEELDAIRERLGLTDERVPVGAVAELIVFSDQVYLDDDSYIASIGLVFPDMATAEAAQTVLETALQEDINLLVRRDIVLQELIQNRGGTFLPLEIYTSEATGKAVLRVAVQADLVKGDARNEDGMMLQSGLLFKLWVDMLYQRDLLWLY